MRVIEIPSGKLNSSKQTKGGQERLNEVFWS